MSNSVPSIPVPGLLSRLFPVPEFLKMPAAGLEITDAAIRAILFRPGKDGATVEGKAVRLLPEGIVSGGDILNRAALVAELKALAKELDLHFVNANLPDEKVYVFKSQIPKVKEEEIRQNIEFKLDESVPVPAAEAVFEYQVIPRATHTGPAHIDVCVTVLPEETVALQTSVLREAGLEPLSFHTPSQALLNALVARGDMKCYLLLHIGIHKTTIAVAAEGVVRYSTTIAFGSAALTDAIARSFSVAPDAAEKMKSEKSFVKTEANMEFFSAVLNVVSVLCDEVNKVIGYWENHVGKTNETDRKIRKILLTGRDGALAGFDEYLAAALHKPVEIGNIWTNLIAFDSAVPTMRLSESLEYAVAAGLASAGLFS